MFILGIETSCDETSASVVRDGNEILSNIILSQLIHIPYGGVVPELASRAHIKTLIPVIKIALKEAKVSLSEIELIAVTNCPGLVGSLLIGLSCAKGLAYSLRIPLMGLNHLEGHISAIFLEEQIENPFVALVASGGHTSLYQVSENEFKLLGATLDDAAGEAFDKVAKLLGLAYPGGPEIERLAKSGNPDAIPFPRAYLNEESLDFSFSGLKTAVIHYLRKEERKSLPDICASFQEAVVDVLVEKSIRAAKRQKVEDLVLVGGVACNSRLRLKIEESAKAEKLHSHFPSPSLCTDNAAMIAAAGYRRFIKGEKDNLSLSAMAKLDSTREKEKNRK